MSKRLPKFNKPPVVETVLGVDYEPIQGFQVPHYGLFFREIEGKYKKFVELPTIDPQIEKFEEDSVPVTSIRLGYLPETRCLFLDSREKWRLQLQKNRFLSNWAKSPSTSSYPSYELTFRKFRENWNKFGRFLSAQELEAPVAQQCEVSYLNQIEFSSIEDLGKIFPFWKQSGNNNSFLQSPEGVSIKMAYIIPENRGRFYVDISSSVRRIDAKRVISLSLTAKILPLSSKNGDIFTALDIGHEWIVRGFTDLTSAKMHQIWERR